MIWNYNDEVKKIEFVYSTRYEEYKCWIDDSTYAWEIGLYNVGPWDWFRDAYTYEWAKWV